MSESDIIEHENRAPFRSNSRLTRAVKLLTVVDVCEQLNVSRTMVWKLTTAGKLKYLKIGKAVRFHPDAVDEYIAGLAAAA